MIVYTMPKSRIMSAGTVGTSKRIRVNGPEGGGNKLQGLPPICNMRSPLVPFVRTRADGENRNVVFCINQLSGGVGAKRGQFGPGNRAGVGQTGGCGDSKPWWFNNPVILAAFQTVRSFVYNNSAYNSDPSNPDVDIAFIGDHETLKTDHVAGHDGHDDTNPSWLFEPLQPTTSSLNVNQAIELLNSMELQFFVNGKLQTHEIGLVGKSAATALLNNGYFYPASLSNNIIAGSFGNNDQRTMRSGQYWTCQDGNSVPGSDSYSNATECASCKLPIPWKTLNDKDYHWGLIDNTTDTIGSRMPIQSGNSYVPPDTTTAAASGYNGTCKALSPQGSNDANGGPCEYVQPTFIEQAGNIVQQSSAPAPLVGTGGGIFDPSTWGTVCYMFCG